MHNIPDNLPSVPNMQDDEHNMTDNTSVDNSSVDNSSVVDNNVENNANSANSAASNVVDSVANGEVENTEVEDTEAASAEAVRAENATAEDVNIEAVSTEVAPTEDHSNESSSTNDLSAHSANAKKKSWSASSIFLKVALTALAVTVVFNLGSFAGVRGFKSFFDAFNTQSANVSQLVVRLSEVGNLLDTYSLYAFNIGNATQSTITDVLEATNDPYAEYYSAAEYRTYLQTAAGRFVGIGLLLFQVGDYVMVRNVYEGSPAQQAGVEPGDVIVSIDGVTEEWTTTSVTENLSKEAGESVEVVWLRPTDDSLHKLLDATTGTRVTENSDGGKTIEMGSSLTESVVLEGEQFTTQITASEFEVANSASKMIDDMGYIHLDAFNQNAAQDVRDAITEYTAQGAKGFILDLRQNGGGYVEQAIEMVSLFVSDGAVLQLQGKTSTDTDYVLPGQKICDLPLVVLVDDESASASEIVAAALKDHGRATIVGTQTYGKGTVQDIIPLSFGGAIKFTAAQYLSPNGNEIDGIGVAPDVEVSASEIFELGELSKDPQLARAIEVLKAGA